MGTWLHGNGDMVAWGPADVGDGAPGGTETCWWHRDPPAQGMGNLVTWGHAGRGMGDLVAQEPSVMMNGDLVTWGGVTMMWHLVAWGPGGMGTCQQREWGPGGMGIQWHGDLGTQGHADMGNGVSPAPLGARPPSARCHLGVTVPPCHPPWPYLPKTGSRVLGTYWSRWPSVFVPSETRT